MADSLSLRGFSREGKAYERGVSISAASNECALSLAIGYWLYSVLSDILMLVYGKINFLHTAVNKGGANEKILPQ